MLCCAELRWTVLCGPESLQMWDRHEEGSHIHPAAGSPIAGTHVSISICASCIHDERERCHDRFEKDKLQSALLAPAQEETIHLHAEHSVLSTSVGLTIGVTACAAPLAAS